MLVNNSIASNYHPNNSFKAIRVPLKYGEQHNVEKAYKVASDVFFKHHATGITDPEFYTMFFENKKIEDIAEKELSLHRINYQRSNLVESVSTDERNFWGYNGRFPSNEELEDYKKDLLRRFTR